MATAQSASSANRHGHHRGWSIAWGIVLIVIGILAVLMPGVAALATAITLGWLLVLAGVVELIHAFQTRRRPGFAWRLTAGLITVVVGFCLFAFPVAGIATLALWIGAFIFAGGIVRLILAFRVRPAKGWGWVFFDGLLAIVIGALIAWGWPASSIAFIGLLTGFWLLFSGVWRIMLDGRAPRAGEDGALSHAT
jgi:uncharacterized membrane protein HdeD (DUF308 family)